MNAVFIDSSFWIAFREVTEMRHAEADGIMARAIDKKAQFVTTWSVVCEIHANFSRDTKRRELVLRDFWGNPLMTVEQPSTQDLKNAIEILRGNPDKTYPLCDALSFAVMRRLRIGRAASFDRHFKQFGEFEILT